MIIVISVLVLSCLGLVHTLAFRKESVCSSSGERGGVGGWERDVIRCARLEGIVPITKLIHPRVGGVKVIK